MKQRIIHILLALLALPALAVPAAAASLETAAEEIPRRMQPGSILLYDEDCKPQLIQGGFLSEEEEPAVLALQAIPVEASREEAADLQIHNRLQLLQWLDRRLGCLPKGSRFKGTTYRLDDEGSLVHVAYDYSYGSGIYAGMRVEYGPDGYLQNIYYPDPFSPDGYSIHNAPPEDAIAGSIPSVALPLTGAVRKALPAVLWTLEQV